MIAWKSAYADALALPRSALSARGRFRSVRAFAFRTLFLLLLPLAFPGGAFAQVPPNSARDAEEVIRQREREERLREQQERTPDVRLFPGQTQDGEHFIPDETPCFPIREIRLADDGMLEEWGWALFAADPPQDPATGRCLGSRGINLALSRIKNAIVMRGYVTTRILAVPQDISTGILKLAVIPGRIRSIRFADGTDIRASVRNAFPARPGDLLNLRDIEQALENLKRVPTASADIQIKPADRPGESDLVIAWKQAFPFRAHLSVNDGGLKTTGRHLGSLTLSADHLLTLNDLFYVSFNHGLNRNTQLQHTKGRVVHYSLPFGYWLFSATHSVNRYHQTVAGLYQSYLYRGASANWEGKLSRLVHRDAASRTNVSVRAYQMDYRNYIDDTEIEVQRRRMAGWEAEAAHRRFIGEAAIDASLAWRKGTGAFSALRAPEHDFGEGTARPRLISANLAVTYPFRWLGESFRYALSGRAQWNRTPLVPQDRFAIGGRYSVRGFDGQMILMAERGWFARNDLALVLPHRQELYLGLDHGEVGGASADWLLGRRLTGAVVGLRGGYQGVNWDLFVGAPIQKPAGFRTDPVTIGFTFGISL